MELWIRSQDKFDLVPINNPISILEDEYFDGLEKQYQKYNLTYNNKKLGVYNSLERALEILDQIQNILILKDIYKSDRELVLKSWENIDEEQIKIARERMIVYEMPKE